MSAGYPIHVDDDPGAQTPFMERAARWNKPDPTPVTEVLVVIPPARPWSQVCAILLATVLAGLLLGLVAALDDNWRVRRPRRRRDDYVFFGDG